ncbi:MAG: nucleotidyltransferase domain-containing protein [Bacilli bacterium]|nr:nucleotidyltransferase domain-containing protein [Bacilli bacterium]
MPKRTLQNYEGGVRIPPQWVLDLVYQQIISYINSPKKYSKTQGVYPLSVLRMKMFCLMSNYEDVKSVILFGSYSKGLANGKSDIDLIIETDRTFFSFAALVSDIEECFNKEIDAFEKKDIIEGGKIDETIKREGLLIYERRR